MTCEKLTVLSLKRDSFQTTLTDDLSSTDASADLGCHSDGGSSVCSSCHSDIDHADEFARTRCSCGHSSKSSKSSRASRVRFASDVEEVQVEVQVAVVEPAVDSRQAPSRKKPLAQRCL